MPPLIRLATIEDAPAVAAIYRPAVTDRATSFEYEPPNAAEMCRRIAAVLARTPWLICEMNGEVVGYAYAGRHRERAAYQWNVDVSAYVDDRWHRRGIARALYTSLFAILMLQGFKHAFAGIALPNAASIGLHEALGFTCLGVYRATGFKFGRWHDVAWYERDLRPVESDPAPPVPLEEAHRLPEFTAALEAGLGLIR
jgi:L-amino acid N-acyltransferase YncA